MPSGSYRDRDAFAAILAALSATGEFATVGFGTPAEIDVIGADRLPAAVVLPVGWTETRDTDTSAVRRVSYRLTLVVRGDSGNERYQRLDRLTAVSQNAVEGSDLGGGCLSVLTRLAAGQLELALKRLEARAVLTGEFTYSVPNIQTRDVLP